MDWKSFLSDTKKVFQILTKIFLKHLAVSIIWARKLKKMVN